MQIEAILKPRKNAKPRRKKKDDDEDIILDKFADEEVSRLRDIMLNAAMEDDTANKNKLPATAKLKILPLVIETLRKYDATRCKSEIADIWVQIIDGPSYRR